MILVKFPMKFTAIESLHLDKISAPLLLKLTGLLRKG